MVRLISNNVQAAEPDVILPASEYKREISVIWSNANRKILAKKNSFSRRYLVFGFLLFLKGFCHAIIVGNVDGDIGLEI